MHTCTRCGVAKDLSEFNRDTRYDEWRPLARCKSCMSEYAREYVKRNADNIKERTRKWSQENKERQQAVNAAWRAANPDKLRVYRRRANRLQSGTSVEMYDAMAVDQEGACFLCGSVPIDGNSLHVDHDHRCCPAGACCNLCRRKLLCTHCNTALGHFADNIEIIQSACDYLARYATVDVFR